MTNPLVDADHRNCGRGDAGALRDNCRALLAGSRTYGKGLIQSIYELHDSSGLALTVLPLSPHSPAFLSRRFKPQQAQRVSHHSVLQGQGEVGKSDPGWVLFDGFATIPA